MKKIKLLFILSLLVFASFLSAQHTVQLGVEVAEVTDTEKIYDFYVEDFINIVGWQFTMDFDGSKMSFKEIRNPILNDLSNSSFNEPMPGDLISVWVDFDAVPENYTEATVAFQLVFDLIDDDGSELCFETSQDLFEFIVDDEMGNFYLSELLIFDECNQGFSIFIGTTATSDKNAHINTLSDVYLNSNGTLAFTSNEEVQLNLSILGLDGKQVASVNEVYATEGRQSLQFSSLPPGMYVLKVIINDGGFQTIKIVVQ